MANTVKSKSDEKRNTSIDVKEEPRNGKKAGRREGSGKGARRDQSRAHSNPSNRSGTVNSVRVNDVGNLLNFNYPISNVVGALTNPAVSGVGLIPEYNVYRVRYIPTLGADGAANRAANRLIADVRAHMGTEFKYPGGDIAMYCLAAQSLGEFIEHIKRVIRIAATYTPSNRLIPRALLETMDFDIDEVTKNLPQYREQVNMAINALKSVAVPKMYPSHNLRLMLNGSIFKDADGEKAQNIVFEPEGLWKWDLTSGTSTKPADLKWIQWAHDASSGTYHTVSTVGGVLASCMEPLVSDQDAFYINGDLVRAFGEAALNIGGDPITPGEVQEFSYNPYVLYMLHNATIFYKKGTTDPKIEWVVPTGGTSPYIEQTIYVNSAKTYSDRDIIDVPMDNPDGETVMDMCRWKAWSSAQTADLASASYKTNATVGESGNTQGYIPMEVLTGMEAYQFDDQEVAVATHYLPTHRKLDATATSDIGTSSMLAVRPLYYLKSNTASSGTATYHTQSLVGDRNYFTIVDVLWCRRLNEIVTDLNYEVIA